MPTGLFNSPNALPPAPANVGPRSAISDSYQVVFAATNQPIRLPFANIPLGASVSLRGDNGTAANASPAYAATRPDQLISGVGRRTITPDTEINFPCDSLGNIWVMGVADDGITAFVNGAAIG